MSKRNPLKSVSSFAGRIVKGIKLKPAPDTPLLRIPVTAVPDAAQPIEHDAFEQYIGDIAGFEPYLTSINFADATHHTLPFPESPTASKSIFRRRWTILPEGLADLSSREIEPKDVLDWMNIIFETQFPFTPGVESCLLQFIKAGFDIGEIYGFLRPWMEKEGNKRPSVGEFEGFGQVDEDEHKHQRRAEYETALRSDEDFANLPQWLSDRAKEDCDYRQDAIVGNYIIRPKLPPRRVWDLYSNRVLPYYTMLPPAHTNFFRVPRNLWGVSHSWVAETERHSVSTAINGHAWRVPIPRKTTLGDIRDELLALGAEYVFLDVLCLRQKDGLLPDAEPFRMREWRLDVPTMGSIYQTLRNFQLPVVVYFNGLGLPIQDGPISADDNFHWFNRIWTLQEWPATVLLGGLSRLEWHRPDLIDRLHNSPLVDARVKASSSPASPGPVYKVSLDLETAVRELYGRFASNPVDQISTLGFLLGCRQLPLYDPDATLETAWTSLIPCLPPSTRTSLLVFGWVTGDNNRPRTWHPTWEQMKQVGRIGGMTKDVRTLEPQSHWKLEQWHREEEFISYLEGSSSAFSGCNHAADIYFHTPFIIDTCTFIPPQLFKSRYQGFVIVPTRDPGLLTLEVTNWVGFVEPEKMQSGYILISLGILNYWIVAEVIGERRVNSEMALEVSRVARLRIPDAEDKYYYAEWDESNVQSFRRKVKGAYRLVVWK